jgi:hypothetical protein
MFFSVLDDSDGVALSYTNLGIVYGLMGDEDKEMEFYQKEEAISRAEETSSRVAVILSNLGSKTTK